MVIERTQNTNALVGAGINGVPSPFALWPE